MSLMTDGQAIATTDASYQAWAEEVARLGKSLDELVPQAASLGVPRPEGEEWFELLGRKLLPQISGPAVAIVALVGGTNIGKSVIFNHLAGEQASAVSPMAAGTRHPVCLVPAGFDGEARLSELLTGFEIHRWQSSTDPLEGSSEHRLFWRAGRSVPPRLLILDTPDIDSDVEVNWQRADRVRQAADVLVAVLTQQKYNDAAVKHYFRRAVEADKEILVIFNQCDLEEDAEFWPHWLATFTEQTGARPKMVYIAPYDRKAAGKFELPFYEVGPEGKGALRQPSSLRDDLGTLHFDRIKIRALRGALSCVLDRQLGAPAYLARIRTASAEFTSAAELLSHSEAVRIEWPTLPPNLLIDEILDWWHARRSGWSSIIHYYYGYLGRGLIWPFKAARRAMSSAAGDPLDVFHKVERDTVIRALQQRINELDRLAELGNDKLRPRLKQLLGGEARSRLLENMLAAYEQLAPIDDDYRQFVRQELDRWSHEYPRMDRLLRALDRVIAVARPAITVSLTVTGWGLVHEAITNVAVEALVTGGITGGGEALVSGTTQGVRLAAARLFERLQQRYISQRVQWFDDTFRHELLGGLLDELERGAKVAQSDAFQRTQAALAKLEMLART